MGQGSDHEVTRLLEAAGRGSEDAVEKLLPLVYDELRELAGAWMRELAPGQTLQPTALVHEAFLRLLGKQPHEFENRKHFFFAAGRAMRDILVESARAKVCKKRGGGRNRVDLSLMTLATEAPAEELIALDDVLSQLESVHKEGFEIVLLRFFVGLTVEETAKALDVSFGTVERRWRFARAWLSDALVA